MGTEVVRGECVFRHAVNHWAEESFRRRVLLAASLTASALALCAPPVSARIAPNDEFFARQWAASNTGQPVPIDEGNETFGEAKAGTPGADERALQAWQVSTGSRSIVIGEADTGVDYTQPDLAANVWSNPGGIAGCAAGTHGYSVLSKTCEPMDSEPLNYGKGRFGGHGTHVAGIMAAVGDNSKGVAGIDWQATVLPVKWLQAADEDKGVARLIEALRWFAKAAREGVEIRVVNDSPTFEGTPSTQQIEEEAEAIEELGAEGILFVTAAGNTAEDNDAETGRYPCRLDLANELCVTATDDEDRLPSWGNLGAHTVDLAAPGVSIYSTLREGKYGYLSGGSMAAAQVSGAAALILSTDSSLSPFALKRDILDNVDPLFSLSGMVESGGRLDICKALAGCEPAVVTGVSPNSGPASGGTPVTITGAHLDGATTVKFGSVNATSFAIDSPTSITARSPAGAGTVDVTVATPGGASPATAGDRFTYTAETEPPPPTPAPTSSPPGSATAGAGTTAAASTGRSSVLGAGARASVVVLASTTLAVQRGRAAVRLRCVGTQPCSGKLTIAVKQVTRSPGKAAATKMLTIGRAVYLLRAGQTKSLALALNASGRTLLGATPARLDALLAILPTGPGAGRSVTKGVHLFKRTNSAKKSSN
ncbi:MAG TPA: S8 family serine peptidase [Solirubrobacteraceae bacterium]|nr:S8 family serine peptidase [Solirubrobacteraceae bacterium]